MPIKSGMPAGSKEVTNMQSNFKLLLIWLICMNMLFANYNVAANIDNTITFQGYLTDSGGKPFFGTVQMDFDFYKHESSSDTDKVIEKEEDLKRPVQVFNGQYATKLALPPSVLSKVNRNSDVWVEVKIGTEPLTPRVQLTSAVQALAVRGIYYDNDAQVIKIGQGFRYENYADTIDNKAMDLVVSGNVGVGTPNASQARLVISGGGMNVSNGNMYVSGNVVPKQWTGINTEDGVYGAVWN